MRLMTSPEAAQWATRADRYAEPETIERAWGDAMLGFVKLSGMNALPEGVALLSRALDLARRLGDPEAHWFIAGLLLISVEAPQQDEKRLRLADELVEQSRHGMNPLILGSALMSIVHIFLEFGRHGRAEDIMAELRTLAERSRQPNALMFSMISDALMAVWDGRLEEAVAIRRRTLSLAEELGILEFATAWSIFVLPARVHLGNAGRALESNLQVSRNTPQNVASEMIILYCLAHLGRYDEVTEILERMVIARPGIGSAEDETVAYFDIAALEAAVLAGHRRAAELLLCRMASGSSVTSGCVLPTCTGRHLGAAAAFLDRAGEARKYYQKAIKDCTEMKFRPELALSRLQLAELLLEHYPKERAEALEHLDFAIKEFQDMKMQPSLERALRHKNILKA
jgi:tetratricopeptide (TPR) repeat protein